MRHLGGSHGQRTGVGETFWNTSIGFVLPAGDRPSCWRTRGAEMAVDCRFDLLQKAVCIAKKGPRAVFIPARQTRRATRGDGPSWHCEIRHPRWPTTTSRAARLPDLSARQLPHKSRTTPEHNNGGPPGGVPVRNPPIRRPYTGVPTGGDCVHDVIANSTWTTVSRRRRDPAPIGKRRTDPVHAQSDRQSYRLARQETGLGSWRMSLLSPKTRGKATSIRGE